ncbi:MAG: DUF2461 domain-containing protein [Clostridiales bacterium]|nr:DUF2461 domain-containing protein [Clostridiales bacterium]
MFQGFTDETISFMWGIRFNNRRDWFLEHKPVYERELYQPMKELAAEVQERLLDKHKNLELNVKVTRIYRDARRVKYGGLYKDHLWFTLRPPVEDWTCFPCFYFEARPEGYGYGMGYWRVTPTMMEQYRRRILREPEKLEKLARRLNRQKVFALEGDEYKRSKGEVSPLLQPWFNRKNVGLHAEKEYEENSPFFGPELVDEVAQGFEWLLPYYRYFKELELEPPVE